MAGSGGQRFGRYDILSELGRGAMGIVYKARDPHINRVVALKTISLIGQSEEDDREYRQRFFTEAEAAGRLSHPGIVTIFDVGEELETRAPYIVMEYVGGESLDRMLARIGRKLPITTALQLTMEIAEALDSAHSMGVVHRDLKPGNILLTDDGHAKIADFGVAKLNLANQTSAGRSWGTPAYMSPEQLNGELVDGRSDLFSLGVMLYTILTGHRPFQGNSALTVSYKVVNRDPIPATLLDTELPPSLDYIITRAMAKDARERYQRGMEMVLDIQYLREGKEPWSKMQPGSSSESITEQIAKAKARLSSLNHAAMTFQATTTSSAAMRSQSNAHDLQAGIVRKLSVGAWLMIGFLSIGLISTSLNWRVGPPRPTGALPQAEATLSMETRPPLATLSVSVPKAPAIERKAQSRRQSSTSVKGASLKQVRQTTPTEPASKAEAQQISTANTISSANKLNVSLASPSPPPAIALMGIEVEHRFPAAYLSIWVDEQLAYTRLLSGNDKKTLGVFHRVAGHEFHAMQISPGKHHLRVQVTAEASSGSPAFDGSASLDGELASSHENMLHVIFLKNGELSLRLQ
jgi:Serine/threonine protein kinase